jgi:hypothetical protein
MKLFRQGRVAAPSQAFIEKIEIGLIGVDQYTVAIEDN